MKVSFNPTAYSPHIIKKNPCPKQPISFGIAASEVEVIKKAARKTSVLEKIMTILTGENQKLRIKSLEKLDGIQKGLKSFEGMSLKEIVFSMNELYSINTNRGCRGMCTHCFAEAKPKMQSILFEDYRKLTKDLKALQKRLGFSVFPNKIRTFNALVYDADDLHCVVKNRQGKEVHFPKLNKMLYETTGHPGLFDTTGWNPKSKTLQERAEKITKYYSSEKNMKEISQLNVSINPFHSIYEKAAELRAKGYTEQADKIHNIYVERISNALFTFAPLLKHEGLGVIIRAFDNSAPNMEGYLEKDIRKTLNEILENIKTRCRNDLAGEKKYIKDELTLQMTIEKYKEMLTDSYAVETEIIPSEKLKQLFLKRNPQMEEGDIEPYFNGITLKELRQEELIRTQKIPDTTMYGVYTKIVDIDGKVYLFDGHSVIPTDIQFNFINKNADVDSPRPLLKEFTFTKDMI